jgi:hypothetical protein
VKESIRRAKNKPLSQLMPRKHELVITDLVKSKIVKLHKENPDMPIKKVIREFVKYNLPAFSMKTFWKGTNFPKGMGKLLFTNSLTTIFEPLTDDIPAPLMLKLTQNIIEDWTALSQKIRQDKTASIAV